MHYTVGELACLLRFSEQWVRERIKAGDFGDQVLNIRGDLRVPASAVNAFLARWSSPAVGVAGRSAGELLRRLREREEAAA